MSEENKSEEYDVIFSSKVDDDTVIVTSASELKRQTMLAAYEPKTDSYATYLNEGINPSSLSISEMDELLTNAQNDLSKVNRIAAYNRKLVNKNDIVGKTVESIDTNINTEIRLTYSSAEDENAGRNKKKKLNECKQFIKDVNTSIRPKFLTRNSITTAYVEGNWISYLRHEDPTNYKVDIYPLGVAEISDYDINGDPIVLFNINELRSRLSKTYKKNKKNKALFFENIDKEVQANYPKEVYEAFKNKESYAVLDNKYTGVIRVNNMNRRYGVSPICRAWIDLDMLDTLANSDRVNSKARAKKIIHQKMRKETMGDDYKKDFVDEMLYAHANFMSAFQQSNIVVTSPPTVEEIKYVEPKVEMTSSDTYNIYRSKVLATLGIQFLMDSGSQSVSTASISVTQLMRTINSISEQLEEVFKKWYRQILIDNNYPLEYSPDVEVIDAEMLEMAIKKDLVTLLFSTMNCSYTTAYNMLGLDINDEIAKRKIENEQGYEDIFLPHNSQYTNSGNNTENDGGRPEGDDESKNAKKDYDKERNDNL